MAGQLGLRDLQGRAQSEASNTSSGNQNRHHEDLTKTMIWHLSKIQGKIGVIGQISKCGV